MEAKIYKGLRITECSSTNKNKWKNLIDSNHQSSQSRKVLKMWISQTTIIMNTEELLYRIIFMKNDSLEFIRMKDNIFMIHKII